MNPEENFLNRCKENKYSAKSIDKFKDAIILVKETLAGKKRISGEPFFEHNIRVGLILVENKTGPEVVLAGLLHGLSGVKDKIEDNGEEKIKNNIKEKFGHDVLSLIEGVQEVKKIKFRNKKLEAEALRKIIITTLEDVRIILVKLANKLDNLKTIEVLPKPEQKRIAEEVMEIYTPLASRLGVIKIKVQLEDLAFRILNPRRYQEIANFLEETGEGRDSNVAKAIEQINSLAAGKVSIVKIKGRPKQIYSIYRKVTQRGVSINQQYDLLGVRVIVPDEKNCYTLLGLLHEHFEPMEGRLKDYIANPKPNLYRSIHTAVKLPHGKIAEIQIRTPEMDEFAEEGIAAHWRYKGMKSEEKFEKKIAWLREVLDLKKDVESQEFLETAKVNIFGDRIYCYTPKGDAKELPLGASILDFAFSVHEEVGDHAVGGRVNGKFVPLRHQLVQGDVVEILTNKHQRPRRTWLKLVKSTKAKQKIRKSLKEHEKLPAFHYRLLKPVVKEEQGILVESSEFPKAYCILAKCCHPLPGEDIVGIITKRRVLSVHKDDCRFALRNEDRWVPVEWKNEFGQKIQFYAIAEERSGLLADLLHTIANAGFEVKEAKAKLLGNDFAECSFLVIPRDLGHLKSLVTRLMKLRGIKKVYFE